MQTFYTDFDDLFERFAIMTIDGKQTDKEAYNYCKEHTTPELAEKLQEWIKTNIEKMPKQEATVDNKADFKTLVKYIEAGFILQPCFFDDKENCYKPLNAKGEHKQYDNAETKEIKGITEKQTLQELCEQTRRIKDPYGNEKAIELFRVYPLYNKYIVIDIDTHTGKANGLMQWQTYTKKNGLDGIEIYRDLSKYPCYVESPNGGKHLYFKYPYQLHLKKNGNTDFQNLNTGVEIANRLHGITAAGSYRPNAKKNRYTLHGDFSRAEILPLCIYNDMQKRTPEPAKTFTRKAYYNRQQGGNFPKWNSTIDGIIEKAREKNTGGNHELIRLICNYAFMANKDGFNYQKNEIETAVYSLPEVINRKDQYDTQGVINSYFGA